MSNRRDCLHASARPARLLVLLMAVTTRTKSGNSTEKRIKLEDWWPAPKKTNALTIPRIGRSIRQKIDDVEHGARYRRFESRAVVALPNPDDDLC
jgi:hypothetical protein